MARKNISVCDLCQKIIPENIYTVQIRMECYGEMDWTTQKGKWEKGSDRTREMCRECAQGIWETLRLGTSNAQIADEAFKDLTILN